jgi:hypothetical protein
MRKIRGRQTAAAVAGIVVAALGWAGFASAGPAGAASTAAAASAAPPAQPGGTWGVARPVLGLPTSGQGVQFPQGAMAGISCASPGNCSAIGTTTDAASATTHPFVVSQAGGAWGPATVMPGVTGTAGQISCGAPGSCAASVSGSDGSTYVMDETDGTWGTAQKVALGTAGAITGISCASAGNCAAVGGALGVPFVADEVNGTWGAPRQAPGLDSISSPAPAGASLSSVSCAAPGNCTAGGSYRADVTHRVAFLISETSGTWGASHLVPGLDALTLAGQSQVSSVSCGGPAGCAAVGTYAASAGKSHVFAVDEADGTWGTAHEVDPATSSGERLTGNALSCGSPGNCAVAGTYIDGSTNRLTAFVANEAGGTWQAPAALGNLPPVESWGTTVSCPKIGDCTVGGSYRPANPGNYRLFVADDDLGGQPPVARDVTGIFDGAPDLRGLSCTAAGYCSAVGQDGLYPFTVGEATASAIQVSPGTGKLAYGEEQAGTVTVTVTSPAGGTPTGTATVYYGGTGATAPPGTPVCTVALSSGTGSCPLPSAVLPVGTPAVTAVYNGDTNYVPSVSAAAPFTVTRSSTVTRLALTTHTLTYGNEKAGQVTVSVVPHGGGLATGDVQVKWSNGHGVCVITLAHLAAASRATQGTCTLSPATAYPAGTYSLLAAYEGDGNFTGSTSASQPLTINKAKALPKLTLPAATARYGHENTVRLTVKVSPQYAGTPTGTVTIKAGTAVICMARLSSGGTAGCNLSATRLKPALYSLVASYGGSGNFLAATSPHVTLKITK